MAHITTAMPKTNAAAAAVHKPAKHGHRVARSMHIRRADNGGFVVTTHHDPAAPSKQQMKAGYHPMDTSMETVHPSMASVKRHVGEQFGGLANDAGMGDTDQGDAANQAATPMA